MVTHDNIYIPGESFPHWIWFVIEFAIVVGISILISRQIMTAFQEFDEPTQNWIFWGIVSVMFIIWYIIIRGLILKKSILKNR